MEKKSIFSKTDKNRIMLFTMLFLMCFLLTVYIFIHSSMTLKESAMKSDGFVDMIKEIVAARKGVDVDQLTRETEDMINIFVRKTAHFVLFALLGVLTYFLFAFSPIKRTGKMWSPSHLSVSVCILYAISDEIHQVFVDGRKGRVLDVVIDTAGAVAGVLVARGIILLCKRIKENAKGKKYE